MIRQIYLFGLGMTLCLSFCSSPLAAQTIEGDPADLSVISFGEGATGSTFLQPFNESTSLIRAGHLGGRSPTNVAGFFIFQLPDVGEIANPFTSADLEFSFSGPDASAAPTYNVDLYGLFRRPDPIVLEDFEFFVGPVGPNATGNLLQENVLTPTSAPGFISVSVVEFLNSQYAGGAGIGEFVVFRLSPDFNPDAPLQDVRDGYLMASANDSDVDLRPRIEFSLESTVLLGDVNMDGVVSFLDITPFISFISSGDFKAEADIDGNGAVNFLDITPFIAILTAP